MMIFMLAIESDSTSPKFHIDPENQNFLLDVVPIFKPDVKMSEALLQLEAFN